MIDLLPNCIPTTRKVDFNLSRNGTTWLYLYCANCGADGGRVMETDIPHVEDFAFYLCVPCGEKYGEVPNHTMVPDEVFWKKLSEAQIEKYGRELTYVEQITELSSGDSMLSKLARDRS